MTHHHDLPDIPPVKVIFRVFPGGEIIALFPEIPATTTGTDCMSYQSIGQHGAANPAHVIASTRPADTTEAFNLYHELRLIGYERLEVRERHRASMVRTLHRKQESITQWYQSYRDKEEAECHEL